MFVSRPGLPTPAEKIQRKQPWLKQKLTLASASADVACQRAILRNIFRGGLFLKLFLKKVFFCEKLP